MRNPKTHLCIVILFAICVIPSAALATLIPFTSDGKSLVRDTTTGEVWIADMEQFANRSIQGVQATIGSLNSDQYGGVSSWELASLQQVKLLFAAVRDVDDALTDVEAAALFGITYDSDSGYDYDEYGSWGITSTQTYDGLYRAPYLARYPGWPDDLDTGWEREWSSDGTANPDIGAWVKTTEYPVPEPMMILLLGTGMMALATVERRFRRT